MELAELGAVAAFLRLAIGFALGAIVGSFLATLAMRWPAGLSASRGRSRCDSCAAPLAPGELIPLASFALLRGRCCRCRAPIDPRHPAIELAAALIGALSLAAHPGFEGLLGAVLGWFLLILIVLDAEHFWLPDRLTLPLIALGLAAGLAFDPSLADRAIGAAAGFGVLFSVGWLYRRLTGRSGLGGGDPKLLAGIGAWLGWQALPFVVLAGCFVGFAGLAVRAARGERITRDRRLPLGALLAVAAWPIWLAHDAVGALLAR